MTPLSRLGEIAAAVVSEDTAQIIAVIVVLVAFYGVMV